MTARIYHLSGDSALTPMEEAPYDSESLLQGMLANHPDLLAGEQVNPDDPRRWLLVTREMSVPGEEDGGGRWSLDHLFLDQDAVPTLVEVKRSNDTRIRREVVGQMLDYAANAVAYWPVEEVRAKFESRCEREGRIPEEALNEFLSAGQDADAFWQRVKTNLQAGRIRMVFIADSIPAELRRVVEFLNEQMDPAEVLAVEVKQFVGEGMTTFVPRVLGQTESALQKKSSGSKPGKPWDEVSFFEKLRQLRGESECAAARKCLDWAADHGLRVVWGRGKIDGSFYPTCETASGKIALFSVWTYGRVELQFQHMQQPPFDGTASRRELARLLGEIRGVELSDDGLTRRPAFGLDLLLDPGSMEKFQKIFEWAISEIKGGENRGSGQEDSGPRGD